MRVLVLIFYMLLKRQVMTDSCVRAHCGDRDEYCSAAERKAAQKLCLDGISENAEFLYPDIPD